ncbi:hypothetical protein DKB71_15810 [Pseudomonas sp. PLMAX]
MLVLIRVWRAINDDGTLTYSFVEALQASHPGFVVRFAGGVLFLSWGWCLGGSPSNTACAIRRLKAWTMPV